MGKFWFFRSSWTHCAQKLGKTWHLRVSWRALLLGAALLHVSSQCCTFWFFFRAPWAEGGGTQILLMVCQESLHLVILVAPSNLGFQDSVCAEVVSGWSAWAGPTAPNYLWYCISKWWNWDCWALPIKEGGCLASPTCLTHFMSLAKGVLSVAQSKRVIWSFLLGVSSAEI